MKRTPLVLNRFIVALALATQLFLFAPAAQAVQNTHSADMHAGHQNRSTRRRVRRNRCRERCQIQYRQCLRGVANPTQARCRQRYNQCLRRCRR